MCLHPHHWLERLKAEMRKGTVDKDTKKIRLGILGRKKKV